MMTRAEVLMYRVAQYDFLLLRAEKIFCKHLSEVKYFYDILYCGLASANRQNPSQLLVHPLSLPQDGAENEKSRNEEA